MFDRFAELVDGAVTAFVSSPSFDRFVDLVDGVMAAFMISHSVLARTARALWRKDISGCHRLYREEAA